MIAAMGPQAGHATGTPLPGELQHFSPTVIGETDALPLRMSGSSTVRGILEDQAKSGTTGAPIASLYATVRRWDEGGRRLYRHGSARGSDEHSGDGRTPTTGGIWDAKGRGKNRCFVAPHRGRRRLRSDSGDIPSPRPRSRSRHQSPGVASSGSGQGHARRWWQRHARGDTIGRHYRM